MQVVIRSFVALVLLAAVVVIAAPAAAQTSGEYSPPVDAEVSDPFRPPSTPYGPGNRGIEYATSAGTPVAAAADGTVVFAGVVAGRRWVTLRHADDVRTTYGPLDDIAVASGAVVHRGDVVGTAAGALLFTARVGDAYIDPASLFDGGPPRVRLVPEPIDRPDLPFTDRSGLTIDPDALRSAIDWERRHLQAAPGVLLSMTPVPMVERSVDALLEWRTTPCTPWATVPPPPAERRLAILVGGLGSSSTNAAIADVDTAALGYRPADVVRFSYQGGRVPGAGEPAPEFAALTANAYSPRDTVGDIDAAGHRLADAIASVAAATAPGVPIDVIAHSQGGLVTRVAIADLAGRDPAALAHVHLVITLGTPHEGADLAEVVRAAAANPIDPIAFDAVRAVTDLPISPDDPAVRQLVPGSDFLTALAAEPLPPAVRVVSIAARGDLVVPSPRAHLGGATNVIVEGSGPTAHDRLPGSATATHEMALALAGLPPTCTPPTDAVLDVATGEVITNGEHLVAVFEGA